MFQRPTASLAAEETIFSLYAFCFEAKNALADVQRSIRGKDGRKTAAAGSDPPGQLGSSPVL